MAGNIFRRLTKGLFVWLNVFIAVLFLLSCLAPYLNPSTWWFMGFLGLMFPYLAIFLIFYVIFWWVLKPIVSLISIFTLLVGWKQFTVLFATKTNSSFVAKKAVNQIRIIDWNIRSFEGLSNKPEKKRIDRMSIAEAILSRSPDMICLQEFNHSRLQDNLSLFTKNYPYYYYAKDFESRLNGYQVGCIIFSKFPIIDSGKVKFAGSSAESLIYVDVKNQDQTFRLYTTHLQSFKFKKEDYEGMDQIKNTEEKALDASRSLVQKMKLAFIKRGSQAMQVREALNSTPYPSIICGDFNDVPNSYTYYHIKKDWQDAFLESSVGIGRTYLGVAPTLRIDYILPDTHFSIRQFDMVDENLSDHLMLVSDVSLR